MAEKGRVVEVAVAGLSASSTLEFFEMAEKGPVDEAAAAGFSTSSTHASTKYEMQRQISLPDLKIIARIPENCNPPDCPSPACNVQSMYRVNCRLSLSWGLVNISDFGKKIIHTFWFTRNDALVIKFYWHISILVWRCTGGSRKWCSRHRSLGASWRRTLRSRRWSICPIFPKIFTGTGFFNLLLKWQSEL